METAKEHSWHYDYFDPKSLWIFNNPSEFAKSLGIYVTELGHFYQDGNCYTNRVPENSFSINFTQPHNFKTKTPVRVVFSDCEYTLSPELCTQSVALVDNRLGYYNEQTGPTESYFIQCSGFLAEKYFPLIMGKEKCKPIQINWLPSLGDTFEKLVLLHRQPSNEKRDAYASMLLLKILSRLMVESDNEQTLYIENKYVKDAMEIIENHYAEPLKLATIADELHINSSYLSRLFSSETGTTFSTCVTHVRINHAKELLRTTELSVEEVGDRCGFCNSSHFIKLFHANEKMTPMQYRTVWQQKTLK